MKGSRSRTAITRVLLMVRNSPSERQVPACVGNSYSNSWAESRRTAFGREPRIADVR